MPKNKKKLPRPHIKKMKKEPYGVPTGIGQNLDLFMRRQKVQEEKDKKKKEKKKN